MYTFKFLQNEANAADRFETIARADNDRKIPVQKVSKLIRISKTIQRAIEHDANIMCATEFELDYVVCIRKRNQCRTQKCKHPSYFESKLFETVQGTKTTREFNRTNNAKFILKTIRNYYCVR